MSVAASTALVLESITRPRAISPSVTMSSTYATLRCMNMRGISLGGHQVIDREAADYKDVQHKSQHQKRPGFSSVQTPSAPLFGDEEEAASTMRFRTTLASSQESVW